MLTDCRPVNNCVVLAAFKSSIKDTAEANATIDGYQYMADSGTIWNLRSIKDGATGARPAPAALGWTSADAAGLPIAAGLVYWYEVNVLQRINHALRFTVQKSSMAYLFPPATHYASSDTDLSRPPMGMRLRLNPLYNCTSQLQTVTARVICKALQTYGMILADNGGDGAISGEARPDWDLAGLEELKRVALSNFEAVETGAVLCTTSSCSDALFGLAPNQQPF
jgi:hypothetical protein